MFITIGKLIVVGFATLCGIAVAVGLWRFITKKPTLVLDRKADETQPQ